MMARRSRAETGQAALFRETIPVTTHDRLGGRKGIEMTLYQIQIKAHDYDWKICSGLMYDKDWASSYAAWLQARHPMEIFRVVEVRT